VEANFDLRCMRVVMISNFWMAWLAVDMLQAPYNTFVRKRS
jgi:hypothetical protein